MRLNKREVTKLAEDLNSMDEEMNRLLERSGSAAQESLAENRGAYLYMLSMLLNMDGDVAAQVQVRREELRGEREVA